MTSFVDVAEEDAVESGAVGRSQLLSRRPLSARKIPTDDETLVESRFFLSVSMIALKNARVRTQQVLKPPEVSVYLTVQCSVGWQLSLPLRSGSAEHFQLNEQFFQVAFGGRARKMFFDVL